MRGRDRTSGARPTALLRGLVGALLVASSVTAAPALGQDASRGASEDADREPNGEPDVEGDDAEDPSAADDEDVEGDEDDGFAVGDVVVVGSFTDPDEAPVPAQRIGEEELRRQRPLSVVDVVRRAQGVTVRDEEGVGLRPNIGYRGLYSDRSRNVLVLEDGVPIAMMPYDYPELYVAPAVERYRSVELVHGASMLIYGPRTAGAVLNFVTLAPPSRLTLVADARVGTDGYYYGFASAGTTFGDLGVLATAMVQHFDGPRHLDLNRVDTMLRFNVDLHDAGELRLKVQFYDEDSTSTNLGLTQAQFDAGVLENFAQHDRFPVRRGALQGTHQVELSEDVTLATTAYFSFTTRDWWRQDFLRRATTGAPVERIVDGMGRTLDPATAMGRSDGSSIYFLDSTVGRLRAYLVTGVEPRLTARYDVGAMRGEVIAGVRLHYEDGRNTDLLGQGADARSGITLNAGARSVLALSAYVRPTFRFFDDALEIAPGVRLETMWATSSTSVTIVPGGIDTQGFYFAPSGASADATPVTTTTFAPIPGISGMVHLVPHVLTAYGGIHRGFVPPGVRDSILGTGRDLQLQPEWSWNYELGVQGDPAAWLEYDVAAFAIDYESVVLMPTEASTTAMGGLATAGRAINYGLEARVRIDPIAAADLGFELPITASYTYVESHFGAGWPVGVAGRVFPYTPAHTLSARVDFVHPFGIEAQVGLDYTSYQYADAHDTVDATLDGTLGVVPARAILNARLSYTYEPWGLTFYVDGRNLLDTRYVASRAPAGINPGMTRQIFGGIRFHY